MERREGLSPHNGGIDSCGKDKKLGVMDVKSAPALHEPGRNALETGPCLSYNLIPTNSQFLYNHLGWLSLGPTHQEGQSWQWVAAGGR